MSAARNFTDTAIWQDYRFHLAFELQRRPATLHTYANTLDRWHRFLGRRDWRTVTSKDLGRFLARGCGAGQRRAGQPLSDAVKRHYTAGIKSYYRWATQAGLIERNPMEHVVLGKTPTPMPRDIPMTDIRSLLGWVRPGTTKKKGRPIGDERAYVAVWLGFGAGLRVSEIAGLRIEHVVLHGPRPHLQVIDGKGGRSRRIPLGEPLREVLGAYLAQRPGVGPVLERRHPADGRPMTGKTVTDVIRAAMAAASIKARPHDLRHTYATMLLQATRGEGLLTVTKLLGLSSTTLVETTYGAGYRGELDAVAALLPDPRGNSHG
jgi:site-specific recombinase XerD